MKRIEQFSTKRPVAFGLAVTFVFFLMVIVSAVLGNLWPGEEIYGQPGNIIGRFISVLLMLTMLSRFGWLRPAGFTSLGGLHIWLIILVPLAYAIVTSAFALTGSFIFSVSSLTGLVTLFILIAAFMEEIIFRGLILHGFIRIWGSTKLGLIKSVLVSSLLFCSIHLLDFLSGRPLAAVLLQSLEAFFLGIFLAILVLSSKSIYPAAFFHSVLNLAAYLSFASLGVEPTSASWFLLGLIMLPLVLFGIYLLRRVSLNSITGQSAI